MTKRQIFLPGGGGGSCPPTVVLLDREGQKDSQALGWSQQDVEGAQDDGGRLVYNPNDQVGAQDRGPALISNFTDYEGAKDSLGETRWSSSDNEGTSDDGGRLIYNPNDQVGAKDAGPAFMQTLSDAEGTKDAFSNTTWLMTDNEGSRDALASLGYATNDQAGMKDGALITGLGTPQWRSVGEYFTPTVNETTNIIPIPKPPGLAVGDLMLALVGGAGLSALTFGAPDAGWTIMHQRSTVSGLCSGACFWKTADASDIAASVFNFIMSSSGNISRIGQIHRISGVGNGANVDVNFLPTGAEQTWVVPANVESITFVMEGAQGGGVTGSTGATGGFGNRLTGALTTTPGETLRLRPGSVGGQSPGASASLIPGGFYAGGAGGIGNPAGGGGGGASDIRRGGTADSFRVAVAAGGGGACGAFGVGTAGGGGSPTLNNEASPTQTATDGFSHGGGQAGGGGGGGGWAGGLGGASTNTPGAGGTSMAHSTQTNGVAHTQGSGTGDGFITLTYFDTSGSNPINASAEAVLAASALDPDPDAPSVTTTVVNTLVFGLLVHQHLALPQTHLPGASNVERSDIQGNNNSNTILGGHAQTRVFAAAGATGTVVHDCTETVSTDAVMFRVAVTPGNLNIVL